MFALRLKNEACSAGRRAGLYARAEP
eukprot:COSAG04_NODE_26701_length_291_cov_2.140625_1_plen_25_part_10